MALYFAQVLFGNVHCFLRCSSALDGRVGERENGIASAEIAQSLHRLADIKRRVVWADPASFECLG